MPRSVPSRFKSLSSLVVSAACAAGIAASVPALAFDSPYDSPHPAGSYADYSSGAPVAAQPQPYSSMPNAVRANYGAPAAAMPAHQTQIFAPPPVASAQPPASVVAQPVTSVVVAPPMPMPMEKVPSALPDHTYDTNPGCGSSGGCKCGPGGCASGTCDSNLFPLVGESWSFGMRPGQFFVGGEYLAVQAHFSDAQGLIRTQTTTAGAVDTQTNDILDFHFDREGSERIFLGYHLCDCDADIKLTYWYLQDGANLSGTATADTTFAGFNTLAALVAGDTIATRVDVHENIFDLTFTKKFAQGAAGCSPMPVWDFSWMGGVRLAEMQRRANTTEEFDVFRSTDVVSHFEGAGPMMGLEGRRNYFGGILSTYMSSDLGLILGGYKHQTTRVVPGLATTVETQDLSTSRLAPVIDFELGTTWRPLPRVAITGGWMLQAWFDLGMSEQVDNQLAGGFVAPLDNSNILAFDGFFIRAEFNF